MNYDATIKRTDLRLRTQYLDIDTTIYKVHEDYYEIYCENVSSDFTEFSNNFDNSIKPITTPVRVVSQIPQNFAAIIPGIPDEEIPKDFAGITMTKLDLLNLLAGKFPSVYFYDLDTTAPFHVTIKTAAFKEKVTDGVSSRFLSEGNREKILLFLSKVNPELTFKLEDVAHETYPGLQSHAHHNPIQYVYSTSFRRDQAPEFAKRDEALWFDNVEGIFRGEFKKKDLFFFNENEYSCYVDSSVFEYIDIRNHLLLFPTIYMTLPYDKDIPKWLAKMKIQPDEFLELIKRGRIKIVLIQPEFRYHSDFLLEIFKANPNAIISRRALTALQQIDIIEIADKYLFNDYASIKELKTFCDTMCQGRNIQPSLLYSMITWPLRARRESFERLHYSGLIGVPSFGVNQAIEKTISSAVKRDLSFEFMISSSDIHLANSFNSTYFPRLSGDFSDYHYANIMGGYLNFYRNATIERIKSFVDSRDQIDKGILPINPIDVFEINDYIPILEFEKVLSKEVIYPNSKLLIEHLADLSHEEREKTIAKYNKEVSANIAKKNGQTGVVDLGSNIALDIIGTVTGFNALGSTLSVLKTTGGKITDKIPNLKSLRYKIEESFYEDKDKKNIHYLTHINRVARVKRF